VVVNEMIGSVPVFCHCEFSIQAMSASVVSCK